MKRVILSFVVALLLASTVLAQPAQVRTRTDVPAVSSLDGAVAQAPTRFSLDASRLNLCTDQAGVRYQLDVAAREGASLFDATADDITALLGPAAFQLNRQLLQGPRGVELTDPGSVGALAAARNQPEAHVAGKTAELRLALLEEQSACAGQAGSGFEIFERAAEECAGHCDCTSCVCVGSDACCDLGCDVCWAVIGSGGGCGPQ